jgi:hypothetical protein
MDTHARLIYHDGRVADISEQLRELCHKVSWRQTAGSGQLKAKTQAP